jgi:hypothetical protein
MTWHLSSSEFVQSPISRIKFRRRPTCISTWTSPKQNVKLREFTQSFHTHTCQDCKLKKKTRSQFANELYRPSDRRLSAKLVSTFYGKRMPRGQRDESLRPYSRLSRLEPLLFLPSSSSIVLTRLSGPRSNAHVPYHGYVFTEPLPSNEKRDTLYRGFA